MKLTLHICLSLIIAGMWSQTLQAQTPPSDRLGATGWAKSAPFQIDTRPGPPPPNNLTLPEEKSPNRVVRHAPMFAWTFAPAWSGDHQTAFQCRVETQSGSLIWDGGKETSTSNQRRYGGPSNGLQDGQTYRLLVKVWNTANRASDWTSRTFRMNTAPPAPNTPSPASNTQRIIYNATQTVSWSLASDPDGDALIVSLRGNPGSIPSQTQTAHTLTTGQLNNLASGSYAWQVVVSDGYEETPGPIWTLQIDRKGAIGSGKSAPFQVDTRPVPSAPEPLTLANERNANRVVNHQPEFAWAFHGVDQNDRQTAYRLRVLSGTTVLWDSGKRASTESNAVFGGANTLLKDGQSYTAQVRVWNHTDKESAWAQQPFQMNTAPPVPTNPRPIPNAELETDSQTSIAEWDLATDADGDALQITLLGDLNTQTPTTERNIVDGVGLLSGLSRDGSYVWRVVVSDGFEDTPGPIWSFTVRGTAPVAQIQSARVNGKELGAEISSIYAQVSSDQLSFLGAGIIRGNPAKTIVSHWWLLQQFDTPDIPQKTLSTDASFNIPASEIGVGDFYLIYNVTDSEGNIGSPDTLIVNVRRDVGLAIIVAGGGYQGDSWSTFTEYTASVTKDIYNWLTEQRRYSKDAISYLCPLAWQGMSAYRDIIRVTSTELSENSLKTAIDQAETRNVKLKIPLLIFLAGHGGNRSFYLRDQAPLKAETFKAWLDALNTRKMRERQLSDVREIYQGEIIIVADFCYTRTFLEQISGPGRIVIGSSSTKVSQVSKDRSFGRYFFEKAARGMDIWNSFEAARSRIKLGDNPDDPYFDQEPYIDANGDGIPYYNEEGFPNPGAEQDYKIALTITIGAKSETASALNPEIDNPTADEQADGTYILKAMADQQLHLFFTAIPKGYDLAKFPELPTKDMIRQTSVQNGNKRQYQATWTPPGKGEYILMVQGIDDLKNIASHRVLSVHVGPQTAMSADFDNNGKVDFNDFLAFASGFGKRASEPGWNPTLDLNNSGMIDFNDFLDFAKQFGNSSATKPTTEE